MNKLNFNQTGGFPLSTNILDAMQEAYSVFNSLGSLAGDKAIISGCVVAGNNVSDGVIYLNGEILPFKGGTLGTTIIIKEDSENRIFEDGATRPVIFKRYVTFGSSTPEKTYQWADFKRIDNLLKLKSDLQTHSHNWQDIGDKPTVFPPSDHTHNWSDIQNTPGAYPPVAHRHSVNDIDGLVGVAIAGKIGARPRRIIKKLKGDFTISADPSFSGSAEIHRITHNLGHTDYIVMGQVPGRNMKLSCDKVEANYCVVATSNDASGDVADFDFMITSFKGIGL